MYLDKPMKDNNLLQAICRTNRTFGQEETHGLIVDYIGIFDDVAGRGTVGLYVTLLEFNLRHKNIRLIAQPL
jgi:hypothetical protein